MFCIACAAPLTPGISYCNRCGASLKEPDDSTSATTTPFVVAITVIAVIGMGIMLGGVMTLRKGADLPIDFIGIFMLLTFIIILLSEILLVRQLSKITKRNEPKLSRQEKRELAASQPYLQPGQRPFAPARVLAQPVGSVTENTTRTLAHSSAEPRRFEAS